MTNANWPEHWLTDPVMDGLSDAAFRVFAHALMWSVAHGTDGRLPVPARRFLHPDSTKIEQAIAELIAVGKLVEEEGADPVITGFLDHQTPAARIEEARRSARERQQQKRDRDRLEAEKAVAKRRSDAARKSAKRAADKGADILRTEGADILRTDDGHSQVKTGVTTSRVTTETSRDENSSRGDQHRNYAARAREDDWPDPRLDLDPLTGELR